MIFRAVVSVCLFLAMGLSLFHHHDVTEIELDHPTCVLCEQSQPLAFETTQLEAFSASLYFDSFLVAFFAPFFCGDLSVTHNRGPPHVLLLS